MQIIAVTKYANDEQIREVIAAGLKKLGENKVQDAERKIANFGRGDLQWHLIGHLQTNKVRKAVELFDCIQSVDSLRLAEKIDAAARDLGKVMPVLLQVNVAGEPQKHGFAISDLLQNESAIFSLCNLQILGIMMIAPNLDDEQILRGIFRKTRELFEEIRKRRSQLSILSMGMSHDFRLAVEEGATMIRIGSKLYET